MTTNDAFERNLSIWLHEDAEHHVPDHLEEVLQRTATARQRPAWSSLERWLPMDTTFRRSVFARPVPMRAAGAPAPHRPADRRVRGTRRWLPSIATARAVRPGAQRNVRHQPRWRHLSHRPGDHGRPRLVIGGDGFDFSPIFSRDGTKMVFLRSDGPLAEPAIAQPHVSGEGGRHRVRALSRRPRALDWFDWSPDGTRDRLHGAGRLVGRRRRRR